MEICRHDEVCGGCIYQGVAYKEQLEIKNNEVIKALEKWEISYDTLLDIEPTPNQYRYRNKMEYTFGDLVKDGEMTLGMHKKKQFMSIITVDHCQLVHEDFNTILTGVLTFAKEKGYPFYHKKSHTGLLRNLIVRKGERTNEILVNIVTSSQLQFDEAAFVKYLQGLTLENTLVGVLRTVNDQLSDAVYCDELRVLYGQDFYMEKIMDLDFKVSAFSFFQTNVVAAEHLYKYALSLMEDFSGKLVFDLFCGTGTITQTLAYKAKHVVGIEIVEEAVEAARVNAELNNLNNCTFIAGDVFKALDQVIEKPDVIVVDPPRVGIQKKALDKILAYDVKQILYISCNPKTLAENLSQMELAGYKLKSIKAFDNFANTKHTECVCLLER
ncbi:MAG: 23S rRNA (uracil(1939)-C(5))-methyltransferase RlmD [Anaerovoracaceae bacterium]